MRFDDFDLYKIIARRMNNAIPQSLDNKIFNRYSCSLDSVGENENQVVYKLITKIILILYNSKSMLGLFGKLNAYIFLEFMFWIIYVLYNESCS